MKIFVIRHGDKASVQVPHPTLGHNDQPLSALGRKQAKRLAAFLSGERITSIRVSSYRRTLQTIEPFAMATGLVPTVDPLLDEIDTGLVGELGPEERALRFPEFWEAWSRKDSDFRYPGGESGGDVMVRVAAVLNEALSTQGDKVLVAHEGWSKLAMCQVLGLPGQARFHFHVDTCGILELEGEGPGAPLLIRRFNFTLP